MRLCHNRRSCLNVQVLIDHDNFVTIKCLSTFKLSLKIIYLFWNKEKIPSSLWWWFLWSLTSVSLSWIPTEGDGFDKKVGSQLWEIMFYSDLMSLGSDWLTVIILASDWLISCLWARRQSAWPAWSVEHTRNGWRGATAVSTRQQQQQQHWTPTDSFNIIFI